MKLAKAV